ncbi:MAG: T9SS type B sorting domain-containing protein [Bacteroidetes bacterium]|nr:T9SS type B sorting domain-containing protein [Bacteroidota bacterium]
MNQMLCRALLLFSLIQLCTISLGSDYYWVGGKGTWADISHWSSNSGGIPSYTVIPGVNDNVIFDANSFSSSNDTVFIPSIAYSNNFSFQSTYDIPFFKTGASGEFYVNGDLTLRNGFNWNNYVSVFSNGYDNIFDISGASIFNLTLRGNGNWTFPDYAQIQTLNLSQGHLSIQADSFYLKAVYSNTLYGSFKARMDVECQEYCQIGTLQMDNDTFVSTQSVLVGLSMINSPMNGYTRMGRVHTASTYSNAMVLAYNTEIEHLFCENDDMMFNSSNGIIDTFSIDSGRLVNFNPGSYTIHRMEATGSCLHPVRLVGYTLTGATISGITSSNLDHVVFRYMTFSSNVSASNSTDAVGNSGITFNTSNYQTYYWIGGNGNLGDPSHWSLSSGGLSASCLPNEGDTAVFDANSFTQTDTVFIELEANFGGLKISTDKVVFNPLVRPTNIFNIFGNVSIGVEVPGLDSASIRFYLDKDATASFGKTPLNYIEVTNDGKELKFLDDSIYSYQIQILNGIVNFDNRYLRCHQFGFSSLLNIQLSMLNSIIEAERISFTLSNGSLNAQGSHIYVSEYAYLTGNNYVLPHVKFSYTSQSPPSAYLYQSRITRLEIADVLSMYTSGFVLDSLQIAAGTQLSVQHFSGTFKVNNLASIQGICSNRTFINGAHFEFLSSTQLALDYVDFNDVTMTGKAGITANNSAKMHFSSGFTVSSGTSGKKYWVGGTGKWQDPSHWATSSGGSGGNCLPSYNDTVIFDQNSFSQNQDTVFLDTARVTVCAYFDASNLNKKVNFTHYYPTNSYSIRLYTQYGCYLSPLIYTPDYLYFNQNGIGGSDIKLNNFQGGSLAFDLTGKGTHQIVGDAQTVNTINCQNGECVIQSAHFVVNSINIGMKGVNAATSDYPKARLTLGKGKILEVGAIMLQGIGKISGDTSDIWCSASYYDNRTSPSATKMHFFRAGSAPGGSAQAGTVILYGSILSDKIELNKSIYLGATQNLTADSILLEGAHFVKMYSSSSINVSDYFFAIGNNCLQILLQGSGTTPTVNSNSASFNCDFLIIEEVEAIGTANFFAGTNSQIAGNTGNWVQGSNPNLVSRFAGKSTYMCTDSIRIDFQPYYASADSIYVNGSRVNWQSWFSDTGIHFLQAYYDVSCVVYDTFNIRPSLLNPVFLPNDSLYCGLDSIALSPFPDYGSDWNRFWSDSSFADTLWVNTSGTYWMEYQQPGCVVRDSVHLYLGKLFNSSALTSDTIACDMDTLTIDFNLAKDFTLQWMDSDTSHFRRLPPGLYPYQLTDSSCVVGDSLLIESYSISVDIIGDSIFCSGDSVSLMSSVNSGILIWDQQDTLSQYWGKSGGQVNLMRLDSGCMALDSLILVEQSYYSIELKGDSVFCEGDSVRIQVTTNAVNWKWSDGYSGSQRWVNSDKYLRVSTNEVRCNSFDSLPIEQKSLPRFDMYDTGYCGGQGVNIALNQFSSNYVFTQGGITVRDTLTVPGPGTYALTASDSGCYYTDTFKVEAFPPLVVEFNDSVDVCKLGNQPYSFNGMDGYSYYWDGALLPDTLVTISGEGMHQILVIDSNGCQASQSIIFYNCGCRLYFPNAITVNQDGKNEVFKGYGCDYIEKYHLLIYNRWGELVFESFNPSESWDGTFGGKQTPDNVYLYLVNYNVTGQIGPNGRFSDKGTVTILH